jgi:hypothetical protein
MRKSVRVMLGGAASAAVIGGSLAAAVPAMATTAPAFKAVTTSPLHSDTTSVSGSATQADPVRGPVWASDHLKETITANPVQGQPGHWNVKITFGGSTFAGFADPRSGPEGSTDPGGPLLSQGTVGGSIQYNNIASATAPDPGNVPAVQAPNTSLGTVLGQLFDSNSAPSAASVHYLINYTPGLNSVSVTGSGDTWNAGDTYTQAG